MRLNSHPINADRYLIGWGRLLPLSERDLRDARCRLSSIEDSYARYVHYFTLFRSWLNRPQPDEYS
jgi:hypothetical protein